MLSGGGGHASLCQDHLAFLGQESMVELCTQLPPGLHFHYKHRLGLTSPSLIIPLLYSDSEKLIGKYNKMLCCCYKTSGQECLPQVSLTRSLGGGCGVGGRVTPNILASLEYCTEAEAVGRASEKELGQGSMRRFVGV